MSKKTSKFQDEFSELEAIAEWFDQDEIDLDEALAKFERGMELTEKLKSQLSEAKNKVETIKQRFDEEK